MTDVSLQITGPGGKKVALLDPDGSILGRDPSCDIILDQESVSRLHARIHRDMFGSWIIEDLASHNGVFIEGKRVASGVVLGGLRIGISSFVLTLLDGSTVDGAGDTVRQTLSVVDRSPAEEVIPYRSESAAILGSTLLPVFNTFTEDLLELSSPGELYSRACDHLAGAIQGAVAILRLPSRFEALPAQPEVLAYAMAEGSRGPAEGSIAITFSRRVLEAVHSMEEPVMAHSHPGSSEKMMLTFVDGGAPRVVFAARVNKSGDDLDLLYVDLPEEKMAVGMFDFIEAVSRQINFAQKNLFLMELKRTEQALREVNRELKEKDRIKDQYVYRVTHDIKGHIGAIKSCLTIAEADSGIGSPAEKADFVDRASRRATQLSTFITDLLRLTKLRLSGQSELQTFSLRKVIANSLETVSPQATDKRITLEADVSPAIDTMTGDELSITEVVTNLLFNAIKYTPEQESVTLQAAVSGDAISIAVSDTGIGIPPEEVDRVFDEFFRASNAIAFEKEGTGLGLALVKQIVEQHGGTITARNNADQGATFSIKLRRDTLSL